MKRIFSVILCFIFILSFFCQVASADSKAITIESVVTNFNAGTVSISGKLSGYSYSPWRKDVTVGISVLGKGVSPADAEEDNSKVFHVDEISVDKNTGDFTYSFEHKSKEASDDCVIILNSDGYTVAQAEYSFYSDAAQSEILSARNVACADSPLYYIDSLKKEAEKVPYKENGEIYVPLEIAAAFAGVEYDADRITINGVDFSDEYISSYELSEVDIEVTIDYTLGIIYTGSGLTNGELRSIIPCFGIHVSKSGSDSQDGSVNAPVKTIGRALELYHITKENSHIFVRSGTYTETININENYSNLKIRAIGEVKLTPTQVNISKEKFTRVTDSEILNMLPDVARGEVLSAKVSGLTDDSTLYKVFANGKEQSIARYPNGGGFAIADGGVDAKDDETFETLFYSDRERLERWGRDPKARVLLYRSSGYIVTRSRITSTNIQKGTVSLTWEEGSKPYQTIGKRFFVYDTITEIDSPGEWYLDRVNQRIYYYPTDDFNGITIMTGNSTPVIINNTKNVAFDGFTIDGSRRNGINADNNDGLKINNIIVKNVAAHGIKATSLTNSTISNCIVKETGDSGIRVNYKDNDKVRDSNLKPQGNIVENCTVHHVGIMNPIAGAVYFGGTGNTFRYNTVHDTPHMGIWFLGNDNLIEYNDFYNALKYCDDAGVIYGNPGVAGFGTVIQYNRVHDFESLNPEHGEIYIIYLDADTSGITMKGNIIDLSNSSSLASAAMIGGGRNNVADGNILIGGANGGTTNFYMSNRYSSGNQFHSQLLTGTDLYKFINSLTDEQKEKWFTKYSALEEEYGYYVEYKKGSEGTDSKGENIGVARDCVVKNNIVVNEKQFADDSLTYNNKMTSVFGSAGSGTGRRYEIAESTGNQFLATYDASGAEAMKAGSKTPEAKEWEMFIVNPSDGDVVRTGPARFVWRSDGTPKNYKVILTNEETNDVVLNTVTTEPFVNTVLATGEYNLTVESVYDDPSLNDVVSISVECRGDQLDMSSSIDLSRNPLRYKRNATGTIKVYSTDYNGNYSEITGSSDLTYTSSDTTVVTIKADGSYEFVGTGTAIITVSAGNAQSSMVVYSSVSDTDVIKELTLDNYDEYIDKDSYTTTEFGPAVLVDDPVGSGSALTEAVKPKLFSSPTKYKTYVLSMWVYDSLKNAVRLGVTSSPDNYPKTSHQLYYGLERYTDTHYHMYHHHDDPTETPVDLAIPRSKGWHQIFMSVEYDEANDCSYVEFYLDGQLVVKMVNACYITPTTIEQGTTAPFKERLIANNIQSNFAFISTNVDVGNEIAPYGEIIYLFNKELNATKTKVNSVYLLASDGSRIEASASVEDNYLKITPKTLLTAGMQYTLKIDADVVNKQTTLTQEKTLEITEDKIFKVRDSIKTLSVEESYTTHDGRTTLKIDLKSLLQTGKQSLFFAMAIKDKTGALKDVKVEVLRLNPLETLTREISADEDMVLEAYMWDSKETMLPLENKITNIK